MTRITQKLIGPFQATTKPARPGVYKVKTPVNSANKFSYWDSRYGWRLCATTARQAEPEKRFKNHRGLSSMYTAGAIWWGLEKV